MTIQLARRLKPVKPSATLSLNAKAKALAASGADVVSFAAGEPDFATPAFIRQAAQKAIDDGFTRYTPTAGIPELRKAICDKLQRDNQLTFAPDQVLVTVGAKHALYGLFQALLSPGDEVIIFAPYWVSYPDMVRLAEGEPVILETDASTGWTPDPEELRRALTPRTRAVIFNSPSNPTGAVLDDTSLAALADVVRGHDCLLVTDDIYEKLLFVPGPFHNIANIAPDLLPRTVVINGLSKSHAMTGWRLGYAAGPKELIAGMQMIQDQSTSSATSFVQKAAVAALTGPLDEVEAMVVEFRKRRDLLVKGLNAIEGISCRVPEGAFYCFPDVGALIGRTYKGQVITGSLKLSEILLEDFLLAAVPGEPFGAEGFLRLSFATSTQVIERGLARLADFVSQLA